MSWVKITYHKKYSKDKKTLLRETNSISSTSSSTLKKHVAQRMIPSGCIVDRVSVTTKKPK